jgi:hypothetical protein
MLGGSDREIETEFPLKIATQAKNLSLIYHSGDIGRVLQTKTLLQF